MAIQPNRDRMDEQHNFSKPGVDQGREGAKPAKEEGRSLDQESTNENESESDMIEE